MRLKDCRFRSWREKAAALRKFLTAHGDDLPAAAIQQATRKDKLREWTTECDRDGLAAAMRYERNDWYLCTVKNAAVRHELRGRGLGNRLYARVSARAMRDRRCLVLAGDVDVANKASIRAIKRAGFRVVNTFCWKRGQRPARILHYVKLPPAGRRCP